MPTTYFQAASAWNAAKADTITKMTLLQAALQGNDPVLITQTFTDAQASMTALAALFNGVVPP